ncbi:DUF1714 domain-containing protein [Lentinula raphanica]|uniref:histone acetyltransferase n=1 Tax=Lentinula raphanica TaxID=153919 RepID=A0AA38PKB6_9AGAR|nr:DUF1714 domain-containing protein [Lentinula raphanica]KAJ3844071.1 DUF1714 domain-containing protein [Lentinula raphanica]KAJ3972379.1 DUF1714 domain-containing protein [Lentinula raphanica]
MSINLRDALLKSLTALPGVREFHLHALVSSPRKHLSLFPFSKPKCRSYLQDVLILLSEQSTPDSPRILVTVIEACVYHVPSTSSIILYISKVDSTGQCTSPSPTATLVRALLFYYADPTTRPIAAEHLWIQLFARAQSQYLFPNSADFSGKRPLGDIQLCGWWKRVFTDVALQLESRGKRSDAPMVIRLFYILPGYNEIEAEHSLKPVNASRPVTHSYQWTYGHPYSQTEIPLPCPRNDLDTEKTRNLGCFIPSFDDDPKSRFMDEIAYTTGPEGIKSPPRKRARATSSTSHGEDHRAVSNDGDDDDERRDGHNEKDDRPLGELGKVSVDEFWERMSFRQECVAGAVTGFFALGMSSFRNESGSDERSAVSPLAPQPGQVSSKMNKRVITSLMTGVEFSTRERAIRATELIEGTIRGLCEGISVVPAPVIHAPRPRPPTSSSEAHPTTTEQDASFLAPPRTPPPRMANGKRIVPDVSPNPFPEPETSLETYQTFIYGSTCISNPLPQNKDGLNENKVTSTPPVTILTARRKKKRQE